VQQQTERNKQKIINGNNKQKYNTLDTNKNMKNTPRTKHTTH